MSSQKGFAPILLLGVLLLVFIVGGVYVYQYKTPKTNIQTSGTQTPIPTPNEISGWQTYTNTQFGFTIRHPNLSTDAAICGQQPVVSYLLLLTLTNISVDSPNSCDDPNYFILVTLGDSESTIDQEIEKIKERISFKNDDVSITEGTLGKNKFRKMRLLKDIPFEVADKQNYWFKTNHEYYFFYDSKLKSVYTVLAHFEDPKYQTEIEKIVSTLTFDPAIAEVIVKTPFYQYFPQEAFTTPNFTKRNYDKSVKDPYIKKEYYSVLDKIPDSDLIDFKCSHDIYINSKDMKYFYGTGESAVEIPIGAQLNRILTDDPRVGFRGLQYCLTSDNREYILATVAGGPLELIQLNGDKTEIKAKDSAITGWYSYCSDILAITKDGNFYTSCGGGDTSISRWVNKINISSGKIEKVASCFTPHEETGLETSCDLP